MKLIDLTLPTDVSAEPQKVPLKLPEETVTGMVYNFSHNSMAGSYIDFPGHLVETGDGIDAGNYPIEDLFQIPTWVIHLDRQNGSGGVTSSELKSVLGDKLLIVYSVILVEGAKHSFGLRPAQQNLCPAVVGFFDKNLKEQES